MGIHVIIMCICKCVPIKTIQTHTCYSIQTHSCCTHGMIQKNLVVHSCMCFNAQQSFLLCSRTDSEQFLEN